MAMSACSLWPIHRAFASMQRCVAQIFLAAQVLHGGDKPRLDPLRCAKKKPVAVLRQALYWDLRGLEFVGDAEANFVGLQINIRIGRNSKRF